MSEVYSLMEAYQQVYQPQDVNEDFNDWIDFLIQEGYDLNDYTDEELLEAFLDERKNENPKGVAYKAGINKPDAWGPPTPFGQEATRGSLAHGMAGVRRLQRAGVRINRHHRNNYLAHKVHQGWSSAAENSPNQTEAQRERRGKLIKKDLATFRRDLPKPERAKDVPFVKKAERAANKTGEFAEDYNLYDIVLDHLLDEGYVDSEEAAILIMANMSEEWRESIIDEVVGFGGKVDPNTGKWDTDAKPTRPQQRRISGSPTKSSNVRGGSHRYFTNASGYHNQMRNETRPEGSGTGLSMSPIQRGELAAKRAERKGQGKRANEIRTKLGIQ